VTTLRYWLMMAAASLFAAGLSGCAHDRQTPEPRVVVVEKAVPVASPCVPKNLDTDPKFRVTQETLKAAADAVARYPMAVAGMLERDAWINEAKPVVAGCPKAIK